MIIYPPGAPGLDFETWESRDPPVSARGGCRSNVFDIDPLRGIVAGVAGGAVAQIAILAAGLQQAVE